MRIFRKFVEKIEISLKTDNNEGFSKICREKWSLIKNGQELKVLYMKTDKHVVIISLTFLLRKRNFSGKRRENKKFMFCGQ